MATMNQGLKWELVGTHPDYNEHDIVTWRARVPGGWLVTTWAKKTRQDGKGTAVPGGSNLGGGVAFVPDPEGAWDPPTTLKPE